MIKFITLSLFMVSLVFAAPDENEIFQAMQDEIDRSLDSLNIEGLQEPYYIEYKITKNYPSSIKSSNGSITQINSDTISLLNVGG